MGHAWPRRERLRPGLTAARSVSSPARPIAEVEAQPAHTWATGIDELDRVLGGGLVGGSVVLLAGEPGVGKSTLLLDVASRVASGGRSVLYVTGEESAAQVRLRAERIGALRPRLLLAAETDLATVLGHVEQCAPDLLVLDSVQTVVSDAVDGGAGGVAQVREVAASLIRVAKARGMATVLVGHVTKDGAIAGPRALEHLVDVVCQFEGERHSRLRLLRSTKNRYGATDEVGCFDLCDTGITQLPDPSGLFLSRHPEPVPGTAVTVTLEGRRPLVAEVQALVAASALTNPRRATSGLDSSRVAMALAVLDRRTGVGLGGRDVYVATVGGVRLSRAGHRPGGAARGGQQRVRRAAAPGHRGDRRGRAGRRGAPGRRGEAPAGRGRPTRLHQCRGTGRHRGGGARGHHRVRGARRGHRSATGDRCPGRVTVRIRHLTGLVHATVTILAAHRWSPGAGGQ